MCYVINAKCQTQQEIMYLVRGKKERKKNEEISVLHMPVPSSWYMVVICFSVFNVKRVSKTQNGTYLICLIRLTSLAPLLLGSVDVVLELDADLPLIGHIFNEWMFEEVLRAGPLAVVLHQTALNE